MKTRTGYLFKRDNGVYYVQWRVNGKLYMRSTKSRNLKDAKRERDRIMAPFLARGEIETLNNVTARIQGRKAEIAEHEESQKKPPLKLEQAWTTYIASPNRRNTGERTLYDYRGYFNRFSAWLGRTHGRLRTLRAITPEIGTAYAQDLQLSGISAGTFNKHRDFLKGFFQVLQREARIDHNPWEDIKRKEDSQISRRELTVEELEKVCQSAEGELRLLLALGIYTGMRFADCATLKWSEVDLKRGLIRRIPNKTRRRNPKPVHIPIHPTLRSMIEDISLEIRNSYVIPQTAAQYDRNPSEITNEIQAHFRANGLETRGKLEGQRKRAPVEVSFHSLRHSFVSLCRESNAPLAVVEAIVGHSNPAMTRHYTHVSEDAAAAAVATLPAIMGDEVMSDEGPAKQFVKADAVFRLAKSLNRKNWKEVRTKIMRLLDSNS